MPLLALGVLGRGLVDPTEPVLFADDEALSRGRAAFETMRVYGRAPFRLDEHLARLAGSAERIGLPAPQIDGLGELARAAIATLTTGDDTVLRVYWTPGREGAGAPMGLVLVATIAQGLDELRARGMKMVSLPLGIPYELRARAPWILGGVKSTSYAVNMAAEAEAKRRGADDAVFLADGEIVLEGPVTNVWWRRGGTLYTPSLEVGILAGVTRATVLEQAEALGFATEQGVYTRAELAGADEAFTSSSVRELMPVVALDGEPIGDGAPGEAARALQNGLRAVAQQS